MVTIRPCSAAPRMNSRLAPGANLPTPVAGEPASAGLTSPKPRIHSRISHRRIMTGSQLRIPTVLSSFRAHVTMADSLPNSLLEPSDDQHPGRGAYSPGPGAHRPSAVPPG